MSWFSGALLCIGLGFATTGCHRAKAPDGQNLAADAPVVSPVAIDGQTLSRTDILLQLLRMPHAEVQTRLGAHRFESHTKWTITPQLPATPVPPPPDVVPGFREGAPAKPFEGTAAFESVTATLEETRSIEVDGNGSLSLSNQNDHGYGVEAKLVHSDLYLRMRYAPFIRQRPEGDELERLRAIGYEPGAAILEAAAPFVYLSTPSETSRLGRPAWQVSFSRQDAPKKRDKPSEPGKVWRGAIDVDMLDGYAIIDRQRGTLLELKLQVRYSAPRGKAPPGTPAGQTDETERVQVAVVHELVAVALGKDVVNIQPPSEWNEPPTRSRPTLEKQELLNGLVSAKP